MDSVMRNKADVSSRPSWRPALARTREKDGHCGPQSKVPARRPRLGRVLINALIGCPPSAIADY